MEELLEKIHSFEEKFFTNGYRDSRQNRNILAYILLNFYCHHVTLILLLCKNLNPFGN